MRVLTAMVFLFFAAVSFADTVPTDNVPQDTVSDFTLPEPGSLALLGAGVIAALVLSRRGKK